MLYTIFKKFFFAVLVFSFIYARSQNIPPNISATGDQLYCPTTQINIATSFNIVDPDDTQIDAFFIQISTGYTSGEDVLILNGVHPSILTSWDVLQGKLSLTDAGGASMNYTDLIAAVNDVVFQASANTSPGDKLFSFTIGSANFLPSTGHYYEYVPALGITWTAAKAAADARTYFGLQGYLATITSQEEAQLSGEQAAGAGWIGGSDAETEGVWKWVTGPEAGTVFWNGLFSGSTPNFANWNRNEPNQAGNEDYAHVTAPGIGIDGSWNDLSNTGELSGPYQPKGYIMEYGGTPGDPVVDISASTKINIPSITNVSISSSVCGSGNFTLEATATSGDIVWFDSLTAITPVFTGSIFTTPILTSTTSYYASISVNGCLYGDRREVTAIVNAIPNVEPLIEFKNCDEDGIPDGFTDFNLNELDAIITPEDLSNFNVTYYLSLPEATIGGVSLTPVPFNNQISTIIYGRVENNITGCYSVSTINLAVSTTSLASNFIQDIAFCDDDEEIDGFREFDLTTVSNAFISQFPTGQNLTVHYYRNLNDAQLEENEIVIPTNYTNETAFSQTLFVRVESDDNGDCFGIGPNLVLTVYPRPEFEVEQSETFCLNGESVTIITLNPNGVYDYEWRNGNNEIISILETATVNAVDVYTVIATSLEGCESFPVSFEVKASGISDINEDDITVEDLSNNNTITIDDTDIGIGDYEFALDNEFGMYQDEPIFSNVVAGKHTVFVRDKEGCGTVGLDVFVMGFPKFFTPNGDGSNDIWNIKGLSDKYLQNTTVSIYDRYGKLIKQLRPLNGGWDGTFNGQILSTNDYWFVVNLEDDTGATLIYKGHFSLIR